MTGINQSRTLLLKALRQYVASQSEAEIEGAILALQTGLYDAFCAYLNSIGHDVAREISFPNLVNMIRDHTDLFLGDSGLPALLVSLNTTRVRIAHPRGDKPSPRQIARDAKKLAKLTRRFWFALFGEECPVSLVPTPQPKPQPITAATQTPQPAYPSRLGRLFGSLREGASWSRFQKWLFLKRMLGIVVLVLIAKWCYSFAIVTARWPEPIKYGGLVLLLVSVGLVFWGLVLVWKVLRQLRLGGLLVIFGAAYLLFIGASLLTFDSSLPLYKEALSATKRLVVSAVDQARDIGQGLRNVPEEFRFAYTGHRRPLRLSGMDPEDSSYLTPVPANRPARLLATKEAVASPTRTTVIPQGSTPQAYPTRTFIETKENTPTPSPASTAISIPLLPPDCPYPQARLTTPKINQVIRNEVQVEGMANIENFDYYKFEIKREDIEDEWHWLESLTTPVEEDVLGTWQVSALPAGTYIFRLTVVDRTGNYPFPPCEVRVYVRH